MSKPDVTPEYARTMELAERLVSVGKFPNMSASEGHELYEGITALTAKLEEAQGYLSRLLVSVRPQVEPMDNLLHVCTQVDNLIAGLIAERDKAEEMFREYSIAAGEQYTKVLQRAEQAEAERDKAQVDEHCKLEVEIHDKIDIALQRLGNEMSHEQGMDDLRELRDNLPPCTPKLAALAALAAAKGE